ncbi:hypothetical protein B0T24DRAFT_684973 [Lasiosphaeria ovina]|uniref:Major facilitator superfamily (MFS) profile domain-containing protein n=1 Tax=Lasiosphaeria ovina TaxID=92902 RepID=A0AAE0JT86_9PEZI|nr:hypothetical protein B0T24DRAFT_684973 [Lasiosphaeria ovina]
MADYITNEKGNFVCPDSSQTTRLFLLPDFPDNCQWLNADERAMAVARLVRASVRVRGIDSGRPRLGKLRSLVLALSDWRVWGLTLASAMLGCAMVLSYFYPAFVSQMGYTSTVESQYMIAPMWAAAFVCALLSGFGGDRVPGNAPS